MLRSVTCFGKSVAFRAVTRGISHHYRQIENVAAPSTSFFLNVDSRIRAERDLPWENQPIKSQEIQPIRPREAQPIRPQEIQPIKPEEILTLRLDELNLGASKLGEPVKPSWNSNSLPNGRDKLWDDFAILKSRRDIIPIGLPSLDHSKVVYTFPTLPNSVPTKIETPSIVIQEISDPSKKPDMTDPSKSKKGEISCRKWIPSSGGSRLVKQRRAKVGRHHRKKREKKNIFQIVAAQKRKKAQTEREFKSRCISKIEEALHFDAEKYVKKIMDRSEKLDKPLSLSGRTLHPHWRELMTIEELYGLPESDWIDKKAGQPSEEEWEEIQKKQKEYFEKYRIQK